MARFLRRFLSIQRPVTRFLTCSTGSQQARTQSLARTSGPPSVANPMAVAVTLRRAIPARLRRERACSANKLVFEPSQPSYTQPWHHLYA